jgi:hypothetical protein
MIDALSSKGGRAQLIIDANEFLVAEAGNPKDCTARKTL